VLIGGDHISLKGMSKSPSASQAKRPRMLLDPSLRQTLFVLTDDHAPYTGVQDGP